MGLFCTVIHIYQRSQEEIIWEVCSSVDVLYYNLENRGESLDGHNCDYQYFLSEPADKAYDRRQKTRSL